MDDLSAIDDFMVDVCKRAEEIVKKHGHPYGAYYAAMLLEYALIEQYVNAHKYDHPQPSDAGEVLGVG